MADAQHLIRISTQKSSDVALPATVSTARATLIATNAISCVHVYWGIPVARAAVIEETYLPSLDFSSGA